MLVSLQGEGDGGVRRQARERRDQRARRLAGGRPGRAGDVEQFRSDIRANLERELKGALMNRLRREVGEQLIAAYADVELPPRLVENEARAREVAAYRAGVIQQKRTTAAPASPR
mgnify:CR=1 FL=1